MARLVVVCLLAVVIVCLFAGCVTAIPATSKMLEASPAVSYEDAWLAVVDAVGERLQIEMIDKDSGYLRTGWKEWTRFLTTYRTRCTARVTNRQPFKVKVTVEKQEYNGMTEQWVPKGNYTELENEILSDIGGRLQRR
jgi:hypothetical protein